MSTPNPNFKPAGDILQIRTPNSMTEFEDSATKARGRKLEAEAEIEEFKLAALKRGFRFKQAIPQGPSGSR